MGIHWKKPSVIHRAPRRYEEKSGAFARQMHLFTNLGSGSKGAILKWCDMVGASEEALRRCENGDEIRKGEANAFREGEIMKRLIVGALVVACVMMFGCASQQASESPSSSSDALSSSTSASAKTTAATTADLSAYEQDGVVCMVAPVPNAENIYAWYYGDGEISKQMNGTIGLEWDWSVWETKANSPQLTFFGTDGSTDEITMHSGGKAISLKPNCELGDIPLNGNSYTYGGGVVAHGDKLWIGGLYFSEGAPNRKDSSGDMHLTFKFSAVNGATEADLESMLDGHVYISDSTSEPTKSGSPIDVEIIEILGPSGTAELPAYLVDFNCGSAMANSALLPIALESNGEMWWL